VFVLYDNAQLARRSPQHRARIERGDPVYITVPVSRDSEDTLLQDVRIELDTPWPVEHLSTIRERYETPARDLEPYFNPVIPPVVNLAADDRALFNEQTSQRINMATKLDQQWRTQKSKLDNYKHDKNVLETRISSASETERDELISEARQLKDEIDTLDSEVRALKQQRDTALLCLGQTIEKRYNREAHKFLLDGSEVWNTIDTSVVNATTVTLTEFTIPILRHIFDEFGIESGVAVASELPVTRGEDPSTYLARLTEYFDGTNYLSGKVGYEEYLDETVFHDRGLDVSVQDWTPTWKRGNVCCLDVLYSSSNPGQYIR
jgi:hypothetical protein